MNPGYLATQYSLGRIKVSVSIRSFIILFKFSIYVDFLLHDLTITQRNRLNNFTINVSLYFQRFYFVNFDAQLLIVYVFLSVIFSL